MKKVLEAELLSIAHRILQMKDKEDVQNLYQEAKELYEKLLILKFHHDSFNLFQPHIQTEEIENKLENAYGEVVATREQMPVDLMDEEYPIVVETTVEQQKKQREEDFIQQQSNKIAETSVEVEQPEIAVTYAEPIDQQAFAQADEKSEVIHYLESEEWTAEDLEEEAAMESLAQSDKPLDETPELEQEDTAALEEVLNQHLINRDGMVEPTAATDELLEKTLEDSFFGIDYQDVDFIRVEEIDSEQELKNQLIFEPVAVRMSTEGSLPVHDDPISGHLDPQKDRQKSLNDVFSQHIDVSLNDRIAFEKNLFNGSAEDFNRVLSQLNTFNSIDQAVAFIEDLVKPDYNYWEGKEEFVGRLMDLIEKRFA
ncbi:hypothetical protein [Flavobacterium sp. JP2137]|uniref:hypothetical protein n=1 Tax=Flavobacterium sp. JP2137 TaxID=3414510 RepID=UPI003D2FABCE